MEMGDKCICQYKDWHNAFGEINHSVDIGMRLTVIDVKLIGATKFFAFEETPEGNYYLCIGFKPLRSLN